MIDIYAVTVQKRLDEILHVVGAVGFGAFQTPLRVKRQVGGAR